MILKISYESRERGNDGNTAFISPAILSVANYKSVELITDALVMLCCPNLMIHSVRALFLRIHLTVE